jgi:signal peptidase II
MRIILITGLLTFFIDQLSKYYVVFYLDLQNVLSINVIPPFLNFRMGWNTGINFGMLNQLFKSTEIFLIVLALLISVALVWWAKIKQFNILGCTSIGLIVGGAIGNAYDRFLYGAVADFINMSCCGIENPFVFNIADIAIFIGVFSLFFINDDKKT